MAEQEILLPFVVLHLLSCSINIEQVVPENNTINKEYLTWKRGILNGEKE